MLRIIISSLIISIFVLIGCRTKDKTLIVELEPKIDSEFHFDPIPLTDKVLYSYEHQYPDYYKKRLANFKNIPELDSLKIVSLPFQRTVHHYNLYKNVLASINQVEKYMGDRLPDTTGYEQNLKYEINAVSGFKDDKQIVIVDADNDGDFGNDEILEFDKNFRLKSHRDDAFKDLPVIDIKHQVSFNNQTYNIQRKIKVIPQSNHPYIFLLYEGIIDDRTNNYSLRLRLSDHFNGRLSVSGINYNFGVQTMDSQYPLIVVAPDSIEIKDFGSIYQQSYQYNQTDTLKLANSWYVIDSLNPEMNQLKLESINYDGEFHLGFRIGHKVKDFPMVNLKQDTVPLYGELDNSKEFTLIDFWGTWCKPCKEAIPDLKRLHNKYKHRVNFVSVALDEDPIEVDRYTVANEMDWQHYFVDRSKSRTKTIIGGLRIRSYPTIIIFDNNKNIVFRGGANLKTAIDNILNKNQYRD